MHTIAQANRRTGRGRAFTIVEVLVVVSIFTVLLTIILPAVNNARESARRSACSANQVRQVTALSRYNATYGHLPNFFETIKNVNPAVAALSTSWVARLLPYLDHNDIYSKMQQGVVSSVPLPEVLCPSALTKSSGTSWICYGVNVTNDDNYPGNGGLGRNATARRKSFDDVRERDGLTNTFLTADRAGRTIGGHNDWLNWHGGSGDGAGSLGFRTWNPGAYISGSQKHLINRMDLNIREALPRGRHPHGVVVTFFDGRSSFLKEDLPAYIIGHLTTSHSIWTGSSYASGTGAVNDGTTNYWLRGPGCPSASLEPVQIKAGINY